MSDLREHHPELSTTVIRERQTIQVDCKKELIYWHICQMFGDVSVLIDDDNVTNTKETKLETSRYACFADYGSY